MVEQLSNFGTTTLNGAINDTTTSVVVTDGSVFPSSGNFRINVENELMLVTARSTNTLTVTRGAESTTAAAHSSGVSVKQVLTAGAFTQGVREAMIVSGTYTGDGTSFTRTDLTLPIPCAMIFVWGTPTGGNFAWGWGFKGQTSSTTPPSGMRFVQDGASADTWQIRLASDGLSFTVDGTGSSGLNESSTSYSYFAIAEGQ